MRGRATKAPRYVHQAPAPLRARLLHGFAELSGSSNCHLAFLAFYPNRETRDLTIDSRAVLLCCCCCGGSISNPFVLLALMCCALLLTFLFPTGEPPRRVVKMGERVLERQERLAGAVIGAWCQLVTPPPPPPPRIRGG